MEIVVKLQRRRNAIRCNRPDGASCGPDILIQAEQIFRIIYPLYLTETIMVRAIGSAYAIGFVGGKEIDVNAAAGKWR